MMTFNEYIRLREGGDPRSARPLNRNGVHYQEHWYDGQPPEIFIITPDGHAYVGNYGLHDYLVHEFKLDRRYLQKDLVKGLFRRPNRIALYRSETKPYDIRNYSAALKNMRTEGLIHDNTTVFYPTIDGREQVMVSGTLKDVLTSRGGLPDANQTDPAEIRTNARFRKDVTPGEIKNARSTDIYAYRYGETA